MIITVSREFGSGGRELGKRLSDALQLAYYDKEIIAMIAWQQGLDEAYAAHILSKRFLASYPLTIGNRFQGSRMSGAALEAIRIQAEQKRIIERLGRQGNCVIIGRCADVILAGERPFNLFVYAGQEEKMRRCMARMKQGETISPQEMARKIREIDKGRARYRALYTEAPWGARASYHLCVNTTGVEIKAIVPALAAYIRAWFSRTDGEPSIAHERNQA